ncbi:hypothetical protein [Paraburkholderia sp. BL25I1N1]|nr:hypothetical protein [Paraburkholderia sp. BL25I1N1]
MDSRDIWTGRVTQWSQSMSDWPTGVVRYDWQHDIPLIQSKLGAA